MKNTIRWNTFTLYHKMKSTNNQRNELTTFYFLVCVCTIVYTSEGNAKQWERTSGVQKRRKSLKKGDDGLENVVRRRQSQVRNKNKKK